MFKKFLALSLCAILAIGVLSGCSTDKAANDASNASKTETKVQSAADLTGAKIGVQEGTTGDIYVTDKIEGSKVSRFKKALDAVMDLKNNQLDAVVIDDLVAEKIIANNDGLKILPDILTQEEYSLAIGKNNAELTANINECLAAMEADGTIDKIAQAYVNGDEAARAELDAKEEPAGEQVLTMGTNAEFEPFEYKDDSGKIVGYDIEIMKEIARRLNMTLEIKDMAFDSLIVALSTDMIDVIAAGMTVTDERKESVDFTNSYYKASQVIIVNE